MRGGGSLIDSFEYKELGDLLKYEQPTKYLVKSSNYNNEYKVPVLTAGKTFILGYTNEKDGIFDKKDLPVIIFDDFTTATKFVDFPFKVKSSAMKVLRIKYNDIADIKFIFYSMQKILFNANMHQRYWISKYSKIKIPLPSIKEQKRIVSLLDKFESLISGISDGLPTEIIARKRQYEYYRNKLLSFKKYEKRKTQSNSGKQK